jgi:hypothetical protein
MDIRKSLKIGIGNEQEDKETRSKDTDDKIENILIV